MGTSYSDFFSVTENYAESQTKKLGAAIGQAFEDAGMVWHAGRAASGWEADASGFNISFGGTGWAVYKMRDTGLPGTPDGIFIKFTIGYRNTGNNTTTPQVHGVRVAVSDQEDFSRKIEATAYTTLWPGGNPFRAWAAFQSGILTFGVDPSVAGFNPIAFGIEQTRARTAGEPNDDGIFLAVLGAFCRPGGNFTYRYAQLDPWATLDEAWDTVYQVPHRAPVAAGSSVAGGNGHCHPVYWYSNGILEQSQSVTEVPDLVAPNATVDVINGTNEVKYRTTRDPYTNTPGYVWAYRFQ